MEDYNNLKSLLTYSAKEPRDMDLEELKTEIIAQRHLASILKAQARKLEHEQDELLEEVEELTSTDLAELSEDEKKALHNKIMRKRKAVYRRSQKAEFLTMYEANITAFISSLSEMKAKAEIRNDKHQERKRNPRKPKKWEGANIRRLRFIEKQKRNKERRTDYNLMKTSPASGYNKEALMLIARDRGVLSKPYLNAIVKNCFDIPEKTAEKLINTGRFTWEQVLILAVEFDMTPREFAETFLNEVFQEIGNGVYRAWNKELFERIHRND